MLLSRPLWGSELASKARQGTGRRSESQLSLQFFSGGRGRTHTHTHTQETGGRQGAGRELRKTTLLHGACRSWRVRGDFPRLEGFKSQHVQCCRPRRPQSFPKSLQGHRTSRQTPDNQAETIRESFPNRCTSTFPRLCKPVIPVLKQLRT